MTEAHSPDQTTHPTTLAGQEPRPEPSASGAEAPDATPSAASELADLLVATATGTAATEQPEPPAAADEEDTPARIDWAVAAPAGLIALAVVAWGLASPGTFAHLASTALTGLLDNFGWAFILFGTVFVAFIVFVAFSKFGTIRLGASDEAPEFRTSSWIAMMFAAGMGIGLMFYGATEPLTYYRDGVPGHSPREVGTAMAQSMFHWTLHPWAIYAVVGLAIAYSTFRVGRSQLLSQAFVPLIGERLAQGWLGKAIDVSSIVATVFGTACSLGVGAIQIRAGLQASGLVRDPSSQVVLGIVLVLTLCFLLSAISGVGKGIQYLSNANMILAALLAVFVFVLGPTVSILNLIPSSIGTYLSQFFEMAGRTAESADATAGDWLGGWTIFYWAWWTSWSPFVGMFLARISRGRTIREFCVTILFVPAGVSVVWFAIFGGTAITLERASQSIWGDGSAEAQLFNLLHTLPGGAAAGVVAMILLATFFITSADSASTVMGSMSQGGSPDASPWVSAAWGVATAAIGLTLLLSGSDGALGNLQDVTIIAASPFLLVLIGLMLSLVKGLREDVIYLEYRENQRFQQRMARERRLHREARERRARRAQLRHPGRALRPERR
ncbi:MULTISPECIES: BCCT family transporter [unclassified Actinomyces]|uniref:BCCT family transporter n=1 Tax=unclassified Actinomyces TaxID=2609248 RepID=UPI0027BA4C0F|nr:MULTISPECIES: BCCT family transporter [unclassified Actinomyces]MCL3776868.1 BCCT family transporter [Actinomyces sp. AC-20-1]MCL3790389.1 BCCT family transporter [Actinomyces sp. 187325]MCL3792805.1 BCCT family transporter [Actinomyces sp. 186855]MCL3795277.1 BCCT family transporter [Actinomyces sp. 217892]